MGDCLRADDSMGPGQTLYSSSGQYRLIYQDDGNLVMYNENSEAIWASNTDGSYPGQVRLERDGYLKIYDGNGGQIWGSEYTNAGGDEPFLLVQDDGNLVIYVDNGNGNEIIWTR